MSVVGDIVASWRKPRAIMRKHLEMGQREDRALVILMLGCALVALAQVPLLVRQSELGTNGGFGAELGAVIFSWLFIAPLAFYVIAAFTHVVALVFRGRGSWFGARFALFWALLAAGPPWLLYGLAVGYLGADASATIGLGLLVLILFVFVWLWSLFEAEFGGAKQP